MGIGAQFTGLDIASLIAAPLAAASESSMFLASSMADFIEKVGFDEEQKTRTVSFKCKRSNPDIDGSVKQEDIVVEVPLISIVPIPNLQIDEVNISFDMEVKQCEKIEKSDSLTGSLSTRAGFGTLNVSVAGNVSSHNSNTRNTDNSAKYHIDVRAVNNGISEGLARTLDIMATTISPYIAGSDIVDENGKPLSGIKKYRNHALKNLREKQDTLEPIIKSAEEMFKIRMHNLLSSAKQMRIADNVAAQSDISNINSNGIGDKEKTNLISIDNAISKLNNGWETFERLINDTVIRGIVADLSEQFTLYKYVSNGVIDKLDNGNGLLEISKCYEEAVAAYERLTEIMLEMDKAKIEYNKAMMEVL